MTTLTTAAVIEAALQLSETDRAKVAAELLESLPAPPELTPEELNAILAERIAAIDSGRATLISSEEAWRIIEADE
jgi:hypothetical protein